jgi:hypothetical protein
MRREKGYVGCGTRDQQAIRCGVAADGRKGGIMRSIGSSSIPLPVMAGVRASMHGEANGAAALVAAFVGATAALSAQEAARVAGVRPETVRKWRRRPPRWLKAGTARRLAAHLAGEAPAASTAEDGFRRAFHPRLRAAPAYGE